MIPIVILLSTKSRLESTALLLPLVILLSQGHKFAPHILLLLDRKAWQHVKQQHPRIKIELVGLIAAPTLIACLTAFLYQPDTVPSEYSKAFYIPVALLAAIYAGWTYFHFSQQNLGILRIYRRLNSTEEDTVLRRVESFLVTSVALFLAAILCTFANERLGFFFLFFFSPLKMPDSLRLACLLLAVGAGCALAFLYGRKGLLNLPTFLGITHFVALTALMCLVPVYLALVAVSVSHWTQAIYLTSLQIGAARSSPSRRLQAPLVIGSILLFSSIMYFAYEFLQTKLPAPSSFGKPDNFELFSPTWIWIELIYFGFNIGINYTHFYLERFIYRRNPRLISVEK